MEGGITLTIIVMAALFTVFVVAVSLVHLVQ